MPAADAGLLFARGAAADAGRRFIVFLEQRGNVGFALKD